MPGDQPIMLLGLPLLFAFGFCCHIQNVVQLEYYEELQPANPKEALKNISVLQNSIKEYLGSKCPLEAAHFFYISDYAYMIFEDKYDAVLDQADPLHSFNVICNLQWNLTQTVPCQDRIMMIQRNAVNYQKAHEYDAFIKVLKAKSEELNNKKNDYVLAMAPHLDNDPITSNVPEKFIPDVILEEAKLFKKSFKENPLEYSEYIDELFKVPADFDEAMSFCARQVQNNIEVNRAGFDKIGRKPCFNSKALEQLFVTQIKHRIDIGSAITVLHDLISINSLSGLNRENAILNLLTTLCTELSETEHFEFKGFLDEFEPFSREWMFMNYKVIGYEGCALDRFLKDADVIAFGKISAASSYLSSVQIICALRQFLPVRFNKYLPYLIQDLSSNTVVLNTNTLTACLVEKTKNYFAMLNSSRVTKISAVQESFNKSLDPLFEECLSENNIFVFRLPDQNLLNSLICPSTSGKKKKRSRRRKIRPAFIDMLETSEEAPVESPIIESSEIIQEVKAESKEGDVNEAVKENAEFDEEALRVELEEYEKEIQFWKAKNAEEVTLPKYSKATVQITPAVNSDTSFQVCFFTVDDFMKLIPDANDLYWENVTNNTAIQSLADRSHRYEWLFDKRIIIDNETYIFLCRVFGLIEGRKSLTFRNFITACDNLIYADPIQQPSNGRSTKNRTVFHFKHSFVVNGRVCIPPCGGVHPEHLSSRFNHKQVKKFLLHGGAHPYFFRMME